MEEVLFHKKYNIFYSTPAQWGCALAPWNKKLLVVVSFAGNISLVWSQLKVYTLGLHCYLSPITDGRTNLVAGSIAFFPRTRLLK